ncbi:MAG: hypothetical protein PUB56_04150, partial [Paraprevotella sp.]|nr:hypothetical protein [Paraprevotella sp.]
WRLPPLKRCRGFCVFGGSPPPVLFRIREQGGKTHLYPPGDFCRALISDVEHTNNRKLSFLLAERRVSDILIFG